MTEDREERSQEVSPFASNLDFLQEEMHWIEQRCQRIGIERHLEIKREEEEEGYTATQTPYWYNGHEVTLQALSERVERLRSGEEELRERIDARLELHRRSEAETLALDELCAMYNLDAFERRVLLLGLAPVFSQKFNELFQQLSRYHSGLTVEVVFNFCQLSFADRIHRRRTFMSSASLLSHDLVTMDLSLRYSSPQDLLNSGLQIANRTFAFLVGDRSMADDFMDFSSVEEPQASFEQVVLDEGDKRRILNVVSRHDRYLTARREWGFDDVIQYGRGILMLFHGKPGTGKTMTAHAVAGHMDKKVLNVDIPTFLQHGEAQRFLPGLFREARLQDAVLFFDECEVLFGDRMHGNTLMTMLLTELERFEGVAILATNLPERLDEALDRRILVKVHFPEPDRIARREIWEGHLPETAPMADDVDLEVLADRFDMTGGYIKNAVLTAVAEAVHGHDDPVQITMEHLEGSARAQLDRPTDDDNELVMPRVRLEDVVLPDEMREKVEELVAASRDRRLVLDRWGIGAHLSYGKGMAALFYGHPGTGKTLCAQAVAGELNRSLLVASIPALVSKWVGETEKNLRRLFDKARAHGAVLFLDEADTLLMERGQGRASRHDDSVVNTLLTLIERHDGVVLLATNLVDALDRALARRLTYRLHFPFPEKEARLLIWRTLLPDSVPTDDTIDFSALAEDYPLTGGQIKNAVFKAAFRAASGEGMMTGALLCDAAAEELADAEGRGEIIGFRRSS